MLESIALLNQITVGDVGGLSAVSIIVALFVGTFISEDAACIAAGALASTGEISLTLAIGACLAGIVVGDLGLYAAGRIFGRRILALKIAKRFVKEASITRASQWLNDRGASAIFVSRFVTGLRLPTYLAAGLLRTDFRKFAMYFVVAAAIWTPLIVASVAFFGGILAGWSVLAGVAVIVAARFALKLFRWRDRRLLIGKLRRIRHWEFWPLAVFYFPVVCYVFLLAIRYRSLTVFTCANPSIPAGGFVGESKDAIYRLIARDPDNTKYLLNHCVIGSRSPVAERIATVRDFMVANSIAFPIILKPDAGERGKGVRIVASETQLNEAIASIGEDHIVQEFFGGGETSVFYYRHPLAETGTIFSMTEKICPAVTGDGISALEELILNDERAVCLAAKYFEANRESIESIPEAGERVQLIRIGTHSRGAIFRDGIHLKTAGLEQAIDRICRRIDGFHFGRFDIRYSSLEDLQAGRGFKIIELNGVTRESTNIYDPQYSLIDAYRILFRQWRIAFEIGAANKRLGSRPSSAIQLVHQVFAS